jgi:RNA polymerase sigma-70 factor (ECF subfamily)
LTNVEDHRPAAGRTPEPDASHRRAPDGASVPSRAGLEARFSALFQDQYARVAGYLLRRTGDPDTARDLAAEAFATAWRRLVAGTLDPARLTPGWLFVAARNLLTNHARGRRRLAEVSAAIAQEARRGRLPGQATAGAEGSDRTLDALDALPETHRQILLAHYWDGLDAKECAALIGCSPGAVWNRLSRARAAFKAAYAALGAPAAPNTNEPTPAGHDASAPRGSVRTAGRAPASTDNTARQGDER